MCHFFIPSLASDSLAIMSNEQVKRCPLCAEEMDWTDQQFKPCKCGYQVCVWCWHQLMELSEKEQTEGRCPGCQTVYEKDKVVAMQAKCEMDVTKNCKKSKPPKAKLKTTEVKKDLTSVRVIRRKMAYIIGLPLSLADENLLQQREYFGQYGKITKISLSRGAGGTIQQFVNETCSVYVTYSKEEEAIRCIQSVHGFVLEDRILRASFGTAKYCHNWLKKIPCSNHACLYLHSMAPEEDTFGRDEVAAVHTRNLVQQIVGATDASKRCGSILPSAVEESFNGSSPFTENITSTRSLCDTSHNGYLSGSSRSPSTSTSLVDVVQRPSSSCPDEDIVRSEDKISLDSDADFPRIKAYEGNHVDDVNSNSNSVQYTLTSSSDIVSRPPEDSDSKELLVDVLKDDMLRYKDAPLKDIGNSSGGGYFHQSSYPAEILEYPKGPLVLHERNHNSTNIRTDGHSVHGFEEENSLPFTCVNSLLNESNELEFQSTVKSNRIRQNSDMFSTEEIVEHLRRIGDNSVGHNEEMSSFDAVETNIISNILSMGLDSSDDSMTLPHGLNDLLDEHDDRHSSSRNSYTSAKSGVSFAKEGFAGQFSTHQCSLNNPAKVSSTCSIGMDYAEHYVSNPQYQAPCSPSLAPPGFSLPCREAPPGFSSFEKTQRVQHYPSVVAGGLVKTPSLPNGFFQTPLIARNNRNKGEVDFYDPAIKSCGVKGKPTNGLENMVFGTRPVFNNHSSSFEDEAKLMLVMQQQQHQQQQQQQQPQQQPQPQPQPPISYHNQDPGLFLQQTPLMFNEPQVPFAHGGNRRISDLDDVYGYHPSLISPQQTHSPTLMQQISQQKLMNRQVSNGRQDSSMDHLMWKNDVRVADIQRNERLGLDRYHSGYGDLVYQMAGSDLYNRGF